MKSTCRKRWCLSACKKSTSSLTSFLRYCRHCKLAILGTLGILEHLHQNHNINLKQAFMLICMQKINCITHFFLKMLQRNSKLVILGNMGMPGHTHLKWLYHFEETFNIYQLHPSHFSWHIYCKDIVNLLFWVLWACLATHTQSDIYYHLVEHFYVYLQAKNQLHPLWFYGDIAKICKLILGTLGMPGYAHPKW